MKMTHERMVLMTATAASSACILAALRAAAVEDVMGVWTATGCWLLGAWDWSLENPTCNEQHIKLVS